MSNQNATEEAAADIAPAEIEIAKSSALDHEIDLQSEVADPTSVEPTKESSEPGAAAETIDTTSRDDDANQDVFQPKIPTPLPESVAIVDDLPATLTDSSNENAAMPEPGSSEAIGVGQPSTPDAPPTQSGVSVVVSVPEERPVTPEERETVSQVDGDGGPAPASPVVAAWKDPECRSVPAACETGGAASAASCCSPRSVYKVKSIRWRDSTNVPIVTQNENGPCPLIAIINVLLLKGKSSPFIGKSELTPDDLVSFLGDCILQSQPKNISEGAKLNYEQNMQDAFSIFHKLQTGLDVNVKFTGVCDFEYTPECIVFDLLNIPLYHGWLVDPQANDVVHSIGKLSYNQLVEKIITNKASPDNDLVTEALIAENFLERSASQLTYYGLYEINAIMKSDELGVLFRNNHFSTILKHKDELFQLVTDQGFLSEGNVIWETLSNIEGDGLFVDSHFVTVPPKPAPIVPVGSATVDSSNLTEEEQIQHDFLVALSIQEEQKHEDEKAMVWQEYKEKELGATPGISDEELAWRLHTEEQKLLAAQQPSQEGGRSAGAGACGGATASRQTQQDGEARRESALKKKKSDCIIL